LKEINELPVERLEDVYEFVHAINAKRAKNSREKIRSFAGAFSDMSSSDYKDFVKHKKKTRSGLFDRDTQL
jgi:hypothetical protein